MADQLYTTTPSDLTNVDLNALSSTYASTYTHGTTDLIKRLVHSQIYDTAPQQFYDLSVLDGMAPEQINSDEFFFGEKTYGRSAITASNSPGAPGLNTQQVINTSDTSMVTIDSVVVYPDSTQGIVIAVTTDTNITVKPLLGGSLPAVTSTQLLPVLGPIEGDAADDIKTYFRMSVTERYNYVQQYVKAMKFGKVEMEKYKRQGTFENYLSMNRQEFFNQVRIDRSNFYWLGTRGEVALTSTEKVKTAGGIYQTMIAAGTPTSSATSTTLGTALESAALACSHKAYGSELFVYCTPQLHLAISKYYKDTLTRYTPDSKIADLMLDMVKIGGVNLVLVPMQRFNDTASFPSMFQNRIFIIDQSSITPIFMMGEEFGTTLGRVNNGTLQKYSVEWVSFDFSQRFVNPLGCHIITCS
jgi:hypothetical protein